MPSGLRWVAIGLLLAPRTLESAPLEIRPTVGIGKGEAALEPYAAARAGVRLQFLRFIFIQPEYLWLRADGHSIYGPAIQLGVSNASPSGLRASAGVGRAAVKGYRRDANIVYVCGSLEHRVAGRVFVLAEARLGLLGEVGYAQFTIGVGVSL